MQFVPSGTYLQPQQSPTFELFPHRVFVGGFPVATTESELREHFEKHSQVREVKIIRTVDGLSKGYGFVSTETEEEADAMRNWSPEKLEFKGKKLNIGPALRKMSANRYPNDYTVATPTGLVPAASLGYSYSVNHPFVMMPPVMFNTPPNTAKMTLGGNTIQAAQVAVAPGQSYFFNAAHQMPQMVDVTHPSQQFYPDNHVNAAQTNSGQRSPTAEGSHSAEHQNGFHDNQMPNSHMPTIYPCAFYVQQSAPVPFLANSSNVYSTGVPYFGTPDASGAPANVFGMAYSHNMVSPLPINCAYSTNMASGDAAIMTTPPTNGASEHDEEVFTPGKHPRHMEHGDPHRAFAKPNSVGPVQHATAARTMANQFPLADPPRYSRAARKINLFESTWGSNSDDMKPAESKGTEARFNSAGRNEGSQFSDSQHYRQSTYKTNRNNGRYKHGQNTDRTKNAAAWKNKSGSGGSRSVTTLASNLSSMYVSDRPKPEDKRGEKHSATDYARPSNAQRTSVA